MRRSADRDTGSGEGRTPAAVVLEELARRRLSRPQLAQQARISLSTLEKALSGRRPFTLATIVRLEQALGVSLRGETERGMALKSKSPPELAPADVGSYTRAAVTWIEGAYLTIRPSFGDKAAVYAYRTEIFWDAERSSLAFRESERIDAAFSQHGIVSVPSFSGHIYLVTNEHGQYRLIVVARPSISGEMHGILTTLQVGRGAHLIPVSAPIALMPLRGLAQVHFGRIHAGHGAYSQYRALLRRTLDEPFAVLLAPAPEL
jgi:transcriptional regulator with XRE-family HTH domain